MINSCGFRLEALTITPHKTRGANEQRERERECVCVRERERERECVCVRERERRELHAVTLSVVV